MATTFLQGFHHKARSGQMLWVKLLLCALLLFVQSADLIHSHDGDLQRQFDCDICLKVGSGGNAIAVAGLSFPVKFSGQHYPELRPELPFIALTPANSRAPPASQSI
jgi:hypothetical protein